MALRFKAIAALGFTLFALYFLFWRDDRPFGAYGDYKQRPVDAVPQFGDGLELPHEEAPAPAIIETPTKKPTEEELAPIATLPTKTPAIQNLPAKPTSTSPAETAAATGSVGSGGSVLAGDLQTQFNQEYDDLGEARSAEAIYGTTLSQVVDVGKHGGFAAAHLHPTHSYQAFSDTPPLLYNPYPDYNSESWKKGNQGVYKPCGGPKGQKIEDVIVFSGHPEAFGSPALGCYTALDIDSNLCFERDTRLRVYGYQEGGSPVQTNNVGVDEWDSSDWGTLQQQCFEANSNRFPVLVEPRKSNSSSAASAARSNVSTLLRGNGALKDAGDVKRQVPPAGMSIPKVSALGVTDQDSDPNAVPGSVTGDNFHGMPDTTILSTVRTAVLIRTYCGQNYTDNAKQNIRALISELSLRSGGEYQVYLLAQERNNTVPVWANGPTYHECKIDSVPQEFWNMTVIWNDAKMQELYPKKPEVVSSVQAQWLSMQTFAQEYANFEYYWNWEFDSRYTGHYYNLLEKLSSFAKAQPRRGLWERNERFYIPTYHKSWPKFALDVEKESGDDTVWGPYTDVNFPLTPTGPKPPVKLASEDTGHIWGLNEEADFISLNPIFNPLNSSWVGTNDVWGYGGEEDTPRRATVITQSRVSKTLLNTMHAESISGVILNAEMAPQTVSLLHGLKAVYAPIPIFFDRAWPAASLQKYFNPGPKGVSGSTEDTPFGAERDGRFRGSTWYSNAMAGKRLYNNWLGWEEKGIGGAEWEKIHGRMCLPPMLLHPVKDVVKPDPGTSSAPQQPTRPEWKRWFAWFD